MQQKKFNSDMLDFIEASPTPFHAVSVLRANLEEKNFICLDEADNWSLESGKRYLVTRNDSSLIAFSLGQTAPEDAGFRMIGAHTDSPCLHIKPEPEIVAQGYYQLGVEVYGGALLNPWFDRDLSIAGKITYRDSHQCLSSTLIDFRRPLAVIPSLAIHLDREANEQRSINKQQHLPPVLMQCKKGEQQNFRALLLEEVRRQQPSLDIDAVLDFELSLYDCQPPAYVGFNQEFIAAARLDNLLSCFTGMRSLLDADSHENMLLVCNDHEEVGSASASGADGPFLKSVLSRICGSSEALSRSIDRSCFISADNAHGIHPNYADKHDAGHGPKLNQGPVIKINANQRYATNSETSALFRHLCELADVPVQSFVVRSDMACGSTIGPITASSIGVQTLDAGVPTFAMHSVRELAGSRDAYYLYRAFNEFFRYTT